MSDFSLKSYVTDHKTIHLVGIGGVSMSALAELLLHLGAKVTGSDRTNWPSWAPALHTHICRKT